MKKVKITQKVYTPGRLLEKTIEAERQGEAYLKEKEEEGTPVKKAYIETYGCQMNFSDTEIIASILTDMGYGFTQYEEDADLVLLNTCSIRENAETKVWNRLKSLRGVKRKRPGMKVGVVGCMAERLKTKLLDEEKLVDMVVGPDSYRSLPELVEDVESGQKGVNVLLSREETYANISPIRLSSNGVTAFISIMRGCDNMCSFCVVPFTRGRERSRDYKSIVDEAKELHTQGFKEVTLLGQNVDSYKFEDCSFAQLLEKVALVSPEMRVRFSTSHPKDINEDVAKTMAAYKNICNYIHLPVQSGNSRILEMMRRGYTREWYMNRVEMIRSYIPDVSLSSDFITGFCSETEEEHKDTLSLIEWAGFHHAYMFFYSERPGTLAARNYPDDIPLLDKKRRLAEVIVVTRRNAIEINMKSIGKTYEVLVEGRSKRSADDLQGRNQYNQSIIFPKLDHSINPGDYINVRILSASSNTLVGEVV